jgi:hypothetical protein
MEPPSKRLQRLCGLLRLKLRIAVGLGSLGQGAGQRCWVEGVGVNISDNLRRWGVGVVREVGLGLVGRVEDGTEDEPVGDWSIRSHLFSLDTEAAFLMGLA